MKGYVIIIAQEMTLIKPELELAIKDTSNGESFFS